MCVISENIKKVAKHYKALGYDIHLNFSLPWLAINDRNNDSAFFMQEHEFTEFLNEADKVAAEFDVSRNEAIFYLVDQSGVID